MFRTLRRVRGPRPDHAHVASKDVPKLGKLVDRRPPENPAHARDSCVALVDRKPGAEAFRPHDHRAQLQDLEVLAVPSSARLAIENRPAAVELGRQRSGSEDRARQNEAGAGDENVGYAVQRVPLALSHICGVPERMYSTSAATVAFVTT